MTMLLVAVGSKNPVKVRATRSAFRAFFPSSRVVGVSVETGIPPQPVGWDQILEGAVKRAVGALEKVERSVFGVGIEAGIVPFPKTVSGYFDAQLAAIADRDGLITLGGSPLFEYPPEVVEEVFSKGVEVEEVMERISGVQQIGEKFGAIGFLTKKHYTRFEITKMAVVAALIPRVNPCLYRLRRN